MLEFLNPWMLAGVGAAAVPIVLHLIMRQSPKRVVFPALRFIIQRKETNRRKLRFRHLLLLVLRVAALCFFALALARPSLTGSDLMISAEDPVSAALVFDTSPSMAYEHANQTRVQKAQEIAEWLTDELPKESQVAVLDSATRQASFSVDLAAAKKRIERLETTVVPNAYLDVVGEALRLLKNDAAHEAREIYLFTDLSKGAWSTSGAGGLDALLAALEGVSIHIIDVGVTSPQNTALADLKLSTEVVPENRFAKLSVSVRRTGATITTPVEVRIAGRDGVVDQRAVTLEQGQAQTLEFSLPTDLPAGPHQGEVRIINQDNNLLRLDDRLYFTLRVVKPWTLLLASNDRTQADIVRDVLAPAEAAASGRAPFEIGEPVATEALAEMSLDGYAALLLVDPPAMSAATWDKLAEYVRGGGKLAVFLGRHAALDRAKESFNSPSAQALLPGEIVYYVEKSTAPVTFDPGDYSHGLLRRLAEDKEYLLWRFVRVRRYWFIQPSGAAEIVMRYTNGEPAMYYQPVGEGGVLTLTTPLADRAANNLLLGLDQAVTTGFLLLYHTMQHVAGGTRPPLNYAAAPNLVVDVPLRERPQGVVQALLRPPAGETSWPSSLPNDAKISVSAASEIGNYRIELKKIGLDEGFSVNLRSRESELARAEEIDLKAVFGTAKYTLARSRDEVERLVRVSRKGQELFPYLIALVAIILGLEHVLANRFYRDESASGPEEAAALLPASSSRATESQPARDHATA